MAIVKMKRLKMVALKRDKNALLQAIQKLGCIEITALDPDFDANKMQTGEGSAPLGEQVKRLQAAIDTLSRYEKAPRPFLGIFEEISGERQAEVLSKEPLLWEKVERLEAIDRKRISLRSQRAKAETTIEQYAPYAQFSLSPADLKPTRHTQQAVGTVQTRQLEALNARLADLSVAMEEIGTARDRTALYLAFHQSEAAEVLSALEDHGFTRDAFPFSESRPVEDSIRGLRESLGAIDAENEAMDQETAKIAKDISDFTVLYETYSMKLGQAESAGEFAYTGSAFYMEGWVPDEQTAAVEEALTHVSGSLSISFEEPRDEEEPSVLLKNGRFASAFEPIIEGFSLPAYHSIDPSRVMAPFYACLFGMMVSDAGYGLVMALTLFILLKIKHIKVKNGKMLYLLAFGGLSTLVWGIVYNTFFGTSPLPKLLPSFPLDPMGDPLTVMGVCVAVGVLHLFAGLGLAAYANLRKGDVLSAVSDQLSWALLLIGLGMLLAPSTAAIGKILALLGAGIILIMAGREKKNIFSRLMSGLGALYGISGWISDVLSYMRLFGMGLATGVIGMVFNELIKMVAKNGIIGIVLGAVLFVFCHLFNLAINVLGAYVHASRLQYIEFFGKFFEDGGRPFAPLTVKPRYVRMKDASASDM